MELLLIRHALPVRHAPTDGPADPGLAEQGVAQARRLATYLATERLDAVYCSPLRRARQTAQPIADHHRLDAHVVDGLAEWDRTATEYVPLEELRATDDPRWRALVNGDWEGDESPEVFHERVTDTIERLIARHRGQRIAAVCHGGVINAYLAHVLGLPASTGFFAPNYTSIHRVAAAGTGERSVVTLNETAHLRGAGLPIGLFQE